MSIGPKIAGLGLGLSRPMPKYYGPRPRPIIEIEGLGLGLGPASASKIGNKSFIKYFFIDFMNLNQKLSLKNCLQVSNLK